ncbi:MAG: tetratricopeptide repeat protein [Bryobacteraceae bacterium]|nr:tetratricopeptide repeat protein [Bryobacteraceae bacterium]
MAKAAPSTELKNFTDRERESKILDRLLYLPSGQTLPVLAFHGVGGAGKTWLAKWLRQRAAAVVPTARIDFDPAGGGGDYRDASQILVEVRLQFPDLACPRFDLAYAWLRRRQGGGDEPHFRGEGALAHAWEAVTEGAEAVAKDIPGANVAKWLLQKLSGPARERFRKSGLFERLASQHGSEDWLALRWADKDDILPQLSRRLTEDLKESLPQRWAMACRAVVVFDTFEALRQGLQAEQQIHNREAGVRDLYDEDSPLLLVICGRDRLRWDEADYRFRGRKYLEQHLVGGLSRPDAIRFLEKCGVGEPRLQEAVLRVSREVDAGKDEEQTGHHPFTLGLCADTIQADAQRGKKVDPESFDMAPGDTVKLARRFLRSLGTRAHETWVKRLSWTPRFDEEAARAAYGGPRNVDQDAAWALLGGFSFVQPGEADGWFRLHSQMGSALRGIQQESEGAAAEAHEFWGAQWASRRRTDADEFSALAWYHEWNRAPEEGLRQWNALAERARHAGRMTEHYRLLGWWTETGLLDRKPQGPRQAAAFNSVAVELSQAALGVSSANLRQAMAAYRAALKVRTREELPQDWATTQNNLGNALQEQGRRTGGAESAALLAQAVAAYRAALKVRTREELPQDWAMTQNNLGNALQEQRRRTASAEGAELLAQAVAAYGAALEVFTREEFPQQWAMTQNNLGEALQEQGLRTPGAEGAGLLAHAVAAYRAALEVFTREELPQDWATTQNNLGNALTEQGRRTASADGAALLAQAVAAYGAALEVYTREELPLDWATTQNNLANALQEQGRRTEGAEGAGLLAQAVAAYRAALEVRTREELPLGWATTQNNLGSALKEQGLRTGVEGAALLAQAVAAYGAALEVRTREELPQQWATTQNNLGNALAQQGLRTGGAEGAALLAQAVAAYRAALEVYTREELPQDWATTQNNLGIALKEQGLRTGGAEGAALLAQAVAAYRAALEVYTAEHFPAFHEIVKENLRLALGHLGADSEASATGRG